MPEILSCEKHHVAMDYTGEGFGGEVWCCPVCLEENSFTSAYVLYLESSDEFWEEDVLCADK